MSERLGFLLSIKCGHAVRDCVCVCVDSHLLQLDAALKGWKLLDLVVGQVSAGAEEEAEGGGRGGGVS